VSKKKETRNKSCDDYGQAVEIFMTISVQFCVKLALFKRDFLHDAGSWLGISWSRERAGNLRSSKLSLHVSVNASKPEILTSECYRAFFLGHPVCSSALKPITNKRI